MGYRIVEFREKGAVAVIELIAPIDGQDELILLSEEMSDCCQKFRMNDENLVS